MVLPSRAVIRTGLFFALLFFSSFFGLVTLSRPAQADEGTILLLVHGDALPSERLRDAIAKELGRAVAVGSGGGSGGVVTVTYRQSARELAVTWDGPKRGTVSRVISAPTKIDDIVRDAAILAGNLARDEADELVAAAPPPLPPRIPSVAASVVPPDPVPLPPAPSSVPPPAEARTKENEDLTLGVFYPLATNSGRPWVRTHFALNLAYGRAGEIDGFQLGGANVVTPADGKGTGNVAGIQLAWAANISMGKVEALQIAPAVNIAGKGLDGMQIAALNIAGNVRGAQLGLINVGRKVDGAMIGLINVADDVDGVPVGLASVTKTGGVHPQAWASNATFGNVGIKLATKHTYTMPSAHYHNAYDRDFFGAGFTIGGHIPIGDGSVGPYVDTDVSFAWLYAPTRSAQILPTGAVDTYHEHLVQPRLRVLFGWRFAEHFGLFGGPGLLTQVRLIRDGSEGLIRVGPEFVVGVEL